MKELSECRILIVDDVPANVDVLVQALRGDYQLSVAIDGTTGLSTAEKLLPQYHGGLDSAGFVCAQVNPLRAGDRE